MGATSTGRSGGPHRPACRRSWTPAVQALLAHLAGKGFAGSPRPLGVDEQGREELTTPMLPSPSSRTSPRADRGGRSAQCDSGVSGRAAARSTARR
jgi:hypothetical protein